MSLCHCLERFSPFGFQATRERLRWAVGATDPGWTADEVVRALEMLEAARAARRRHVEPETAQRRALKRRDRTSRRRTDEEIFLEWRERYFTGETARLWGVAGLGDCERCGHRLIHHGGRTCAACASDPDVAWDARCRAGLPEPR